MNHFKYIISAFFLLFTTTIYSQQKASFGGKITDAQTGNPLAGATITIHDTKQSTTSGSDGSFLFKALAAGKYLVEISFVGYESIVEQEILNGETNKDFTLKLAVAERENVTVTGVSSATRLKEAVQPVTILKRDNLLATSSSNIIASLTHVPGVNALSTGPAISKPFIRGLGYNRVVTINDGVRQEGQQWGDEHGIEIDDYSAQRVEVLKGPASLMYGSDALAGVINIQSLLPAPEGAIKANVLGEYQTNSMLRGGYANVAGTKNGFSFNAYGSYKGAADYKNKYDGPVFNSKFYNQNFGGMLGYSGGWGHSFLNVTNFNQHIGMVEGERDENGNFLKALPGGDEGVATDSDFDKIKPVVPFQHVQHFKISSDNSFNLGKNKLDLTLGLQHNQRREYGDADEPESPEAYFDLKTFNYAARFHFAQTGNWKTSIGLTGMQQTNRNKTAEALIPDYTLLDMGGFIFTQYHKNKLTVSGGLRFDNRHINGKEMLDEGDLKFAGFSKNFSNVSGSAGLSYEASKNTVLKLNVARGFRAPSLAELSSNGAHEGTNRFEIGNKDLKAETSLQVDAGVETNTEHVSFSATAFYSHINNFIFYNRLQAANGSDSLITDPESGDELQAFKFNQHTANLYGVEATIDLHPHPLDWLHFEHTFSYTRARFSQAIEGIKDVPNIPAARYIAELKGKFLPKGKTVSNLFASIESDYTFKQNSPFTAYNTETATSSYWLINAAIGTDFVNAKGKTLFSIYLTGSNLADVAYQNHLSRLKYTDVNEATGRQGVFNMGRNFGIKVNVPLSFNW